MWTRRHCLALLLPESQPVALAWADLPPAAQDLARQLELTASTWVEWLESRRVRLAERIRAGNAEHVTYFVLQSRVFTAEAAVEPMAVAAGRASATVRVRDFEAFGKPVDRRHQLIAELERGPLAECVRSTMEFLRAKEIDGRPLDALYFARGLSSDTAPASTEILAEIPRAPRRILLAGPGLDFTRREKFTDSIPLRSHQLEWLRAQYPEARIDLADVRPEVVRFLGARPVDVTTQRLAGPYDLIVATNLLLYFEDRELLTALAGFARALEPGGLLLHNDQRFAAKVFGAACGLPVEKFAARETGVRRWDRAVIHRKESA